MKEKSIPLDEDIEQAINRLQKATKEYKKYFGEKSLDRVVVHDPTWLDADNFNKGAQTLEEAIRQNKPLKQIPKDIWDNIIF